MNKNGKFDFMDVLVILVMSAIGGLIVGLFFLMIDKNDGFSIGFVFGFILSLALFISSQKNKSKKPLNQEERKRKMEEFVKERDNYNNKNNYIPTKKVSNKKIYKDNKKRGVVSCPKCGSTSITSTNKKISVGKGVTGAVIGSIVNPVGTAVGGAVGATSSKKMYNVCMNCGHKWKP